LVVEDELDSRELLKEILEQCGVRVQLAASAEEALAWLAQEVPDVIVSDVGLPGLSGYEFMERVRKDPRLSNTPAAAITAFARAEDRRKAMAAGFQMHVPKPVEPLELVDIAANLARIGHAMRA
jgi:CheY-like chemotaxis protein